MLKNDINTADELDEALFNPKQYKRHRQSTTNKKESSDIPEPIQQIIIIKKIDDSRADENDDASHRSSRSSRSSHKSSQSSSHSSQSSSHSSQSSSHSSHSKHDGGGKKPDDLTFESTTDVLLFDKSIGNTKKQITVEEIKDIDLIKSGEYLKISLENLLLEKYSFDMQSNPDIQNDVTNIATGLISSSDIKSSEYEYDLIKKYINNQYVKSWLTPITMETKKIFSIVKIQSENTSNEPHSISTPLNNSSGYESKYIKNESFVNNFDKNLQITKEYTENYEKTFFWYHYQLYETNLTYSPIYYINNKKIGYHHDSMVKYNSYRYNTLLSSKITSIVYNPQVSIPIIKTTATNINYQKQLIPADKANIVGFYKTNPFVSPIAAPLSYLRTIGNIISIIQISPTIVNIITDKPHELVKTSFVLLHDTNTIPSIDGEYYNKIEKIIDDKQFQLKLKQIVVVIATQQLPTKMPTSNGIVYTYKKISMRKSTSTAIEDATVYLFNDKSINKIEPYIFPSLTTIIEHLKDKRYNFTTNDEVNDILKPFDITVDSLSEKYYNNIQSMIVGNIRNKKIDVKTLQFKPKVYNFDYSYPLFGIHNIKKIVTDDYDIKHKQKISFKGTIETDSISQQKVQKVQIKQYYKGVYSSLSEIDLPKDNDVVLIVDIANIFREEYHRINSKWELFSKDFNIVSKEYIEYILSLTDLRNDKINDYIVTSSNAIQQPTQQPQTQTITNYVNYIHNRHYVADLNLLFDTLNNSNDFSRHQIPTTDVPTTDVPTTDIAATDIAATDIATEINKNDIFDLIEDIKNPIEKVTIYYKYLDIDAISINNWLYSKKYGEPIGLCSHWLYIKSIFYAIAINKAYYIQKLNDQYGDNGQSDNTYNRCKICNVILSRLSETHDNVTLITGITSNDLKKFSLTKVIDESVLFTSVVCGSNVLNKILTNEGIMMNAFNMKYEIIICDIIKKIIFKMSLDLLLIDYIKLLKIALVEATYIIKYSTFEKNVMHSSVKKLDETEIKDLYIKYQTETITIISTVSLLIVLQTSLANYYNKIILKLKDCVYHTLKMPHGINTMACILNDLNMVSYGKIRKDNIVLITNNLTERYNKLITNSNIAKMFSDWQEHTLQRSIRLDYKSYYVINDTSKTKPNIKYTKIDDDKINIPYNNLKNYHNYHKNIISATHMLGKNETNINNILQESHIIASQLYNYLMDVNTRQIIPLHKIVSVYNSPFATKYINNLMYIINVLYTAIDYVTVSTRNMMIFPANFIKREWSNIDVINNIRVKQFAPINYNINITENTMQEYQIQALFLKFCYKTNEIYKGTEHIFMLDGVGNMSCVKCLQSQNDILQHKYNFTEYNILLNIINKRTMYLLDSPLSVNDKKQKHNISKIEYNELLTEFITNLKTIKKLESTDYILKTIKKIFETRTLTLSVKEHTQEPDKVVLPVCIYKQKDITTPIDLEYRYNVIIEDNSSTKGNPDGSTKGNPDGSTKGNRSTNVPSAILIKRYNNDFFLKYISHIANKKLIKTNIEKLKIDYKLKNIILKNETKRFEALNAMINDTNSKIFKKIKFEIISDDEYYMLLKNLNNMVMVSYNIKGITDSTSQKALASYIYSIFELIFNEHNTYNFKHNDIEYYNDLTILDGIKRFNAINYDKENILQLSPEEMAAGIGTGTGTGTTDNENDNIDSTLMYTEKDAEKDAFETSEFNFQIDRDELPATVDQDIVDRDVGYGDLGEDFGAF
jgi:hypothetical protein